jgi:hypothetical protein
LGLDKDFGALDFPLLIVLGRSVRNAGVPRLATLARNDTIFAGVPKGDDVTGEQLFSVIGSYNGFIG